MLNLRISGVIAGAAFIFSLLIGLFSRASMPLLLLRPVFFALLFFIITVVVNVLVNRFMPELLEGGGFEDDEEISPAVQRRGSRVDITEGDYEAPPLGGSQYTADPMKPVFMGAQPDDSDEGLGDISNLEAASSVPEEAEELFPAGIDQNAQNSYNKSGGLVDFSDFDSGGDFGAAIPPKAPSGGKQAEPAVQEPGIRGFSNVFSDGVETLPDLDSMAGAFLPTDGGAEPDTTEYSVSTPARKPLSSGKNSGWQGDFNAKDMAKGLQTILSKDKEG